MPWIRNMRFLSNLEQQELTKKARRKNTPQTLYQGDYCVGFFWDNNIHPDAEPPSSEFWENLTVRKNWWVKCHRLSVILIQWSQWQLLWHFQTRRTVGFENTRPHPILVWKATSLLHSFGPGIQFGKYGSLWTWCVGWTSQQLGKIFCNNQRCSSYPRKIRRREVGENFLDLLLRVYQKLGIGIGKIPGITSQR